jgi:hypothetical protein
VLAFWSTSEWAGVLSAFWAAIAATASWVTIASDRRRQGEAMKPNVSAAFDVSSNLTGRITFVNAGPGLAIQLGYVGVDDDGRGPLATSALSGTGFSTLEATMS